MKSKNLKIRSAILATILAGGIALGSISNVYADTNYKEGTFIEQTMENGEKKYNQYVVQKGDNASYISQKICRYFGVEPTAEFWPVIAFLNNYPRVIQPGDIVVFPSTYDVLVEMNARLRETGWLSRYIIKNNIYKKTKKPLSRDTVADLLYEIYGDSVCIDEDFIRQYLKIQGLDKKYELSLTDEGELNFDILFDLTEWIPTLDELEDYRMEKATNKYGK